MKNWMIILFFTLPTWLLSQRDLTPGKNRNQVFGKVDYKEYRYTGIQVTAGPTFMLNRINNPTFLVNDPTRPFEFTMDPTTRVGGFLEVGLIHIPKKRSKLSQALKYIFVSYIDWGIGYKQLSAAESTTITSLTPSGNVIGSDIYASSFSNGFLFGRFSLHKNVYLGKKYFIDNGLGFNVDYNLVRSPEGTAYTSTINSILAPQVHTFHHPLVAQLHYSLGFGIKLSRRSMLIPGASIPIMGLHSWRNGGASLKWFDSNYLPLLAQVKWTYLFEKKVKGCAPARVNDQDKNTMNNQ